MSTRIKPLEATAAQWVAGDPVIPKGWLALETDTGLFKMGNGETSWGLLGYINASTGVSGPPAARAKSSGGTVYPNVPGVSHFTIAPVARAVDRIYYEPRLLPTGAVLNELWLEVSTLAASGVARIAVYAADGDWQPAGNPLVTSSALDTSATGIKKATGLDLTLLAGRYVTAVRYGTAGPSVVAFRGSVPGFGFGTSLGASACITTVYKSEAYAATFASPGTKWDTVTNASSPFENTALWVLSEIT